MNYTHNTPSTEVLFSRLNPIFKCSKSLALVLLLLASTSAVLAQTPHATGISNDTVYLNDLEDHTWTYYSAKPDTQYPDALRSPDPRNVKITYRGGSVSGASAVAVSPEETQNTFVYYKTIEKYAWGGEANTTTNTGRWLTGEYAYRVIPNPFSKRPKNGNTYYGFGGWKIVSGAGYIRRANGQMAAANAVLNLEEKINFVGLDYDVSDPNAVTAEVVFEATWVTAIVSTATGNVTSSPNALNANGTYETNFIVFTNGGNKTVSGQTKPVTVSNRYPDGTNAGTSTVNSFTTSSAPVKLEYVKIGDGRVTVPPSEQTANSPTTKGSGRFYTNGIGELIVGRGCIGTVLRVNSANNGRSYSFRIESGKYTLINPLFNDNAANNENANNYCRVVLGCDYDRANNDNNKLRVINYLGASRRACTGSGNSELSDIIVKSGYYGYSANYELYNKTKNTDSVDGYGLGIGGNTDGYDVTYTPTGTTDNYLFPDVSQITNNELNHDQTWYQNLSFYVGPTRGAGKAGVNRLLVEGGEFTNINGGGTNPGNANTIGFYFRMKGGWVKGAVYGTASISNSTGSRRLVFTGGEVNGWVAGGCNGTDFGNGDGYNEGICYIYAGGSTEFRSHNRDGVYTNATGLVFNVPGGQIFGAGRGLAPSTNSNPQYCGSTTTAYVVVADDAEVEQNVYGGGYNGVSQYSHVYITGGTVGGKVFGGTARAVSTNNTWRCRTTDVRMYGGTVVGGVYGSHDETGRQYNDVSVQILGGTVGAENQKLGDGSRDHDLGNVFGCGYGVETSVQGDNAGEGDVVVVIGDSTARTPHVENPVIWGNVFCGGHEANYTSTNKTFKVMGYNGLVKQSIYGGGKGVLGEDKGTINGNTLVWLKGSIRVVGNVFGGGLAGQVKGKTDVRITD